MEPFFKLFKILIIRAFILVHPVVCSFVLVFPPCTVRSTDAPGYGPEYNYIIQIRKNYHLNSWDNGTSPTIIGSISYWAHKQLFTRAFLFEMPAKYKFQRVSIKRSRRLWDIPAYITWTFRKDFIPRLRHRRENQEIMIHANKTNSTVSGILGSEAVSKWWKSCGCRTKLLRRIWQSTAVEQITAV